WSPGACARIRHGGPGLLRALPSAGTRASRVSTTGCLRRRRRSCAPRRSSSGATGPRRATRGRPGRPRRGAGGPLAPPAGQGPRRSGNGAERRHGDRALSARMATASERWPLVRQPSLRRWSALDLLLGVVALTEVASRTALVERRGAAQPSWLAHAKEIQATIR